MWLCALLTLVATTVQAVPTNVTTLETGHEYVIVHKASGNLLSSKVVDGTIRLLSYAENIGTETQLGFTFTLEASGNATYPYFLKNAKLTRICA